MLSGFTFLSSPQHDCRPIITLTQVLISNYKPVTKLISSCCRRARGATWEFRWISSADFCAFSPSLIFFTLCSELTFQVSIVSKSYIFGKEGIMPQSSVRTPCFAVNLHMLEVWKKKLHCSDMIYMIKCPIWSQILRWILTWSPLI